ncbi:TPA: LexA family transcriptional regulator [Campylobacter jejuni]|nr:LexA family transcriptional regulator [Campylobacter jejuni]HEF6991273.1 LexA family transcriptional regulator [Campylobacter jejuni]HEF7003054.1 LexA family transcriptional regulator [Campylobacter jejuni]HEF7040405.1 LexA family transcriptional regulator [Campylobacter jejuni]HEF7129051.1 LexA family transcriptional regulator [Campylobacter jejuni]
MEIGKKIRIAREEQGYSQEQLANELGITARTLQNYEYGRSDVGVILVGRIAKILKINSDYFFKDDSSLVVRKSTDKNVRKSFVSDEKMFVSETNLKNVSKSTNFVSYSSPNTNLESQTLNDDMINIPFFENVRASAGSGAYNDEESTQALGLSKSFLRECFGLYSFINLSVILGQGDSMAPTLPENCYLLIQQGEVAEGEICVTRIEDELYVKRLQKRPKLKLLSDNKAYEPINLEGENFEILGRVVGYFKKTTL